MLFLPDAMMLAKHTSIMADSNNLTDADFNTYSSDLLIPFEVETLVLSFSKNSLSLISFRSKFIFSFLLPNSNHFLHISYHNLNNFLLFFLLKQSYLKWLNVNKNSKKLLSTFLWPFWKAKLHKNSWMILQLLM